MGNPISEQKSSLLALRTLTMKYPWPDIAASLLLILDSATSLTTSSPLNSTVSTKNVSPLQTFDPSLPGTNRLFARSSHDGTIVPRMRNARVSRYEEYPAMNLFHEWTSQSTSLVQLFHFGSDWEQWVKGDFGLWLGRTQPRVQVAWGQRFIATRKIFRPDMHFDCALTFEDGDARSVMHIRTPQYPEQSLKGYLQKLDIAFTTLWERSLQSERFSGYDGFVIGVASAEFIKQVTLQSTITNALNRLSRAYSRYEHFAVGPGVIEVEQGLVVSWRRWPELPPS